MDPKRAMLEGKNKILLFRKLSEANSEAAKLSFQTSHTFDFSRDAEAIMTKDGTIRKLSELESEVTGIEAIQAKDDPVATMLLEAVLEGDKMELWEVTVDEDLKNEDGKYPAIYCQGYMTSWSSENGAEDEATYSGDFAIELTPQFGFATLTEEQQQAVQYAFQDTTPEGDQQ
ncbi:phage major tail protein, TP901-1 family [Ornithinibacillus sp. BX22]|uniref:Phage major tail protein, TP901-1 family n=2 Tax=Ornithinibacillus TaxID=484508 RepID=A0A923L7J7_9BACI|nr:MULTISPECIES: phage major tail protein, TP901-1 family [Ornithinibacillus]MBC5637854.1 phage major tail protein, TP901-1 family [Ornithinibacillus hominis]MBS3681782.1 phage major tail protein, TP901-1 family [Ornithinibacillus massiliensis]